MNDLRIKKALQRLWNVARAFFFLRNWVLHDTPRYWLCNSTMPLETTAKRILHWRRRIWTWISMIALEAFVKLERAVFLRQRDWTTTIFRLLRFSTCFWLTSNDTLRIRLAALFFVRKSPPARWYLNIDCITVAATTWESTCKFTSNNFEGLWIVIAADSQSSWDMSGLQGGLVYLTGSNEWEAMDRRPFVLNAYLGILDVNSWSNVLSSFAVERLNQFWILLAEHALKCATSRLNTCSSDAFTTKMASFRGPHFSAKLERLIKHFKFISQLSRRGNPFSLKWTPISRCQLNSMSFSPIFIRSVIHQ